MKLLSRFFRSSASASAQRPVALVPPKPPVRAAPRVTDVEQRVATIHQLLDGDPLRSLAGLSHHIDADAPHVPAAELRAAQVRMAQLIDAGTVAFPLLDSTARLGRLVVESSSSRLRQLAAERIEDPTQLRELVRLVRGKDKSVYKILKGKCDALNAAERQAAAWMNDAQALCVSLERHSRRSYDIFYAAAFERLEREWRTLLPRPAQSVEQLAANAIDECRRVIALQADEIARHSASEAAALLAKRAASDADERVRRAAREAAQAKADADTAVQATAAALRSAEEQARVQNRAAEEHLNEELAGMIRRANDALSDGNTQKAASVRRAIDEKSRHSRALPASVLRQLQSLDVRLTELKQWKDYAVAPKRVELIDDMEKLVGSTEEPRILADRIKSLQDEWRTISQGIASETHEEWQRFHHASQAAYQPCREHFEKLAKQRLQNLESRKGLLARLAAVESAHSVEDWDWRLLTEVLREAPREWRQYAPVDRTAGRSLQSEFDISMGRLQTRLDSWYAANVVDKQSLIQRARQLLAQDDVRAEIEEVKRLQTLWRETGPAPREQHQSLWSEFREVCDAVYQKREQAFTEYSAGLAANKVSAEAICAEAEAVATLAGAQLMAAGMKIAQWRTAFDAIGELPRTDSRGLEQRLERAMERCKARVAEQSRVDSERSYAALFEAGRRLRAYEWSLCAAANPREQQAFKNSLDTFIAAVERWPKGGLQALEDTLAAGVGTCADSETRQLELRKLCIRCEIHHGLPTPPVDETLRREFQVQRLMQGLGQGNRTAGFDMASMALEWVRIGGVEPAAYEDLLRRFAGCYGYAPPVASLPPSTGKLTPVT